MNNQTSSNLDNDEIDIFILFNSLLRNKLTIIVFTLISTNEDINLNKVIENCSNGNSNKALTIFENIYENQSTSVTIIRMFANHFKLLERILLHFEHNKNLEYIIENIKPPIFFKKKEFVIFQCSIWDLKSINMILARLIDLEAKCKLNYMAEKTLLSQFILSTSVLARKRIKS